MTLKKTYKEYFIFLHRGLGSPLGVRGKGGEKRKNEILPTYIFFLFLILFSGCRKDIKVDITRNITIFNINDQHGQIDNFSKIKDIVNKENENTDVILVCAGDMFSGNPVVDDYNKKGYPMIDIMNKTGFNISAIGNHEFDYGKKNLADRMEQANFDWVCANVDMNNTGIPQPYDYKTITVGDLKVTFLGLIETNGKPNATIPSTHPLKVEGITFSRPENVVYNYSDVKEQENSDLYIALTHLGYNGNNIILGDIQLAQKFPYFDLIIGGHSHTLLDTVINNIPIFQAGSYLNYLGKIELTVKNKKIENYNYELIDLNSYTGFDQEIQQDIDNYNNEMASVLDEVIGYSHRYHNKSQVGCFYTDALRKRLNVDVSFQNNGGIRSGLNEGDITVREIYEIDPFNNGAIIYNMTVSQIKDFLKGSCSKMYYSGIKISQSGSDVQIEDEDGNILPDDKVLSIGINDYIPSVFDEYFPANGELQPFTVAEALIYYLKNINSEVDYPNCNRFFKYQ